MEDCQHNELKRTADTSDDGLPIYYCAAQCGSGQFVVRPLRIIVGYGRHRRERCTEKHPEGGQCELAKGHPFPKHLAGTLMWSTDTNGNTSTTA